MKNNMLRGPHGRLMRVDVVELQSALLKCKGLAKKGGKKINKVGQEEIVGLFEEIYKIADEGVWGAEQYKGDYEIEDLIEEIGEIGETEEAEKLEFSEIENKEK